MKYVMYILSFIFILSSVTQASENRGLQLMEIEDQTGQEVGLYQESHALVIGVSKYAEGWPDLPGVEKDIQAVQLVLEEQEFHVVVVENPTRNQLDQVFTEFINQFGQHVDNRLMVYFAGHGHTLTLAYGGEMGYIVPVDAPNPHRNETGFLAKAMDMQQIEVYAKRIQSKHVLFVFDSCFSGSIFALSRAVPESITYKTIKPVRQFITSGSAEEQVPDESIFRQQFIAALRGEGDVNTDGYVTGAELGEFLQNTVVNYSKGAQHPQYGKIRDPHLDKGDFVFLLPGSVYVENIHSGSDSGQSIDPEAEMWDLVRDSTEMADIQTFLDAFPQGRLAKVAQLKLRQLEREKHQSAQSDREKGESNVSVNDVSFLADGSAEQLKAFSIWVTGVNQGYCDRLRREGFQVKCDEGMRTLAPTSYIGIKCPNIPMKAGEVLQNLLKRSELKVNNWRDDPQSCARHDAIIVNIGTFDSTSHALDDSAEQLKAFSIWVTGVNQGYCDRLRREGFQVKCDEGMRTLAPTNYIGIKCPNIPMNAGEVLQNLLKRSELKVNNWRDEPQSCARYDAIIVNIGQ